ncbi:ABC transporter ATP-binding protein [Antarcticirhabdus aurantiaca]|uniref:ABC transporter ATP-binding protein n=1 Tax=Antarcticirhabdus aurantiaca TaxID=2606717 RepID=A0ACD4NPB9_9HYPH|nr:ABC transporter ATP-binding protein [Antarcticirhabdus aurantiaca]WAJ28716.1 ABC transporter ATP-binding protein [Jeongeuplla avenae]
MSIRDLDIRYGAHKALDDLDLEVRQGEFLVLLGPSGCGKSTLLNAIAGLLDISDGEIWISGKNVTWAEPKDRGIGMVFQSYALYPRMSVEDNLSFGLKMGRTPKAEIAARVAKAAKMLQLEPLLKRRPAELSGGQRQRVAIGRALVREVDVFLFDEPLSNLDAKLRAELRVEIKRLHQELGNTMIYVTHDQIEALTLADRIAVMKGGIIQQLGPPGEVYRRPVNRFVAGFIGSPAMNFLEGRVENGAFRAGGETISLERYDFAAPGTSGPASLGIRPEHIRLGEAAPGTVALIGRVEVVEPMGADTLVWTSLGGQPLAIRTDGEATVRPGDEIRFAVDPAKASLFGEDGERL